jgi:hypothetical protein
VINTVVTNSLVIPPEITECLNKSEWKQIKLLLGKTQPALYHAWGEDYNNNPKKVGQLDPPRMLDSERVKTCGLKKMYLVACNCDASLYSFKCVQHVVHVPRQSEPKKSAILYRKSAYRFSIASLVSI